MGNKYKFFIQPMDHGHKIGVGISIDGARSAYLFDPGHELLNLNGLETIDIIQAAFDRLSDKLNESAG